MDITAQGYESTDSEDEEQDMVDLGFAVRETDEDAPSRQLHQLLDWSKWDGGRIGGRPSWLNPKDVPSHQDLTCSHCQDPMIFVLQIYCPSDDQPQAFHRSFYVFCCRGAACVEKKSILTLRCQLPRENEFYPSTSGVEGTIQTPESVHYCDLCKQRATFQCTGCGLARYCCRQHQKDHWKHGHKEQCTGQTTCVSSQLRENGSKFVFPEYEISVENEPDTAQVLNKREEDLVRAFHEGQNISSDDPDDPFTNNSAIDLDQKQVAEILGINTEQDPMYVSFLARIAVAKTQVIRYAPQPLWFQSKHIPSVIPPCEHCHADRVFLFQLMPQLLYYLKAETDIDWGTVAIYTCSQSCAASSTYTREFSYRQESLNKIPDDHL